MACHRTDNCFCFIVALACITVLPLLLGRSASVADEQKAEQPKSIEAAPPALPTADAALAPKLDQKRAKTKGAPTSPLGTNKTLPPVRHVNGREVSLEYELSRIGASGIGSVDLWWTPDDGKTWENAPNPPHKDEEVRKHTYSRTVKLMEGDGIYGFSLVVRSRAGLGKRPPRSGDVPEIRIELDMTAPMAQLFSPRPDPVHREVLVFTWLAKDKNLTAKPITLEWSERVEGPWQIIAADLANTGQHAWTPPQNMPGAVYLRLRVRDLAGNEGAFVSPEPQIVDFSEPEGRLVNISVNPKR